jgi:N,N'-diacetyllegionaminate synthase
MSPASAQYPMLSDIELSHTDWKHLIEYSKTKYPKMEVLAFVAEHKSIPFIDSLSIDGYKLSSSDLSNPIMLEAVAQTQKKIHLSVGASTLVEIQLAVENVMRISSSKIALMYGYQNFPTRNDDVHLNYMNKLRQMFELPVGYQDHSDADTPLAFWLPAAAVGFDCDILEKHITHDRSFKGIDHESALNPTEFKNFIEMVKSIDEAKGKSTPRRFSSDEERYRKLFKKSIVASRAIRKGSVITADDMLFLRSENLGLAPNMIGLLLGKRLKININRYNLIQEKDLA